MLKRPKPGEDEEDLLRMQEEYLRAKSKDDNFKPAAYVTNLRPTEETQPSNAVPKDPNTPKQSKYAKSKGLKTKDKNVSFSTTTNSVMGDILEKNSEVSSQPTETEFDDDNVYFPKVIPSLLGGIVERNVDNIITDVDFFPMPVEGFPVVNKRDLSIVSGKKSIHAQDLDKTRKRKCTQMDIDEPSPSCTKNAGELHMKSSVNLPEKSYIVETQDAEKIHTENVGILSKMSEKDILEEQQKLMSDLDPKLIQFLKSKRKPQVATSESTTIIKPKALVEEHMETAEVQETNWYENDSLWENDVLSHPNVEKWLHFDSLEKDKLEWMKGIEDSKKIKADEQYEARFDFKGYLMPYTIEYTEKTKTLFHHGDEPHRPGYSLTELFELTRSTVTQQRVMALNTIAGVLEYFSFGTYKDIIDIPLSKIFFIVRIAMDENKVAILEPALKAMRNLVYNRIDEASLDALIGFEEGSQQPCLENDMSEIEELESQESELKDFHLAEIDIIATLVRTDIIQRIHYILDKIKPSFNCVQYCLQILTRLARDSVETASKIVAAEHLMNAIITHFVPTTSINFFFNPELAYNGKPVLAALKLLRILSLQSKEIGIILFTKFNILKPIAEYITSEVDGTYGLRIQVEALCILANLLTFGVGVETASSLCPVIVTTLYKHVQGTDISMNSSVISATHAAVVLQLINKILNCRVMNLDNYKYQIYPLLKEGVQKWLAQLSISDVYTCAHLRLLCSALDCCKSILLLEQLPVKFLNDSLRSFSSSKGYQTILRQLIPNSNLLSRIDTKDLHLVKNLKSLGACLVDSQHKVLPSLNISSPLPFLASLFKVLEFVDEQDITAALVEKLGEYLIKLSKETPSLCDNWFTRIETDFLCGVIRVSMKGRIGEANKDLLYAVASKLCYILRSDKINELDFIFTNILFNKDWFTADRLISLMSVSDADGFSKVLTSIEDIKLCYSKVLNMSYRDTGPNIVLKKWQEPILPRDWIYLPILHLYSRSQEKEETEKGFDKNNATDIQASQKEFIISCSLEWILFNELCFPDILRDIDITDRFCRIMCVFLCDNSLFLSTEIKHLLQRCVQTLFRKEKQMPFDFNKQLVGLHNFQDFYTQFLEQFQSVSYGDFTFAACVLVPLAQRHDVKWRKLLWSEYAGCLRALDCPEDRLCYGLKDYLYPQETDESLIRSYFQALSGNLLRPNTIAHRIASYHTECFKRKCNSLHE